jgi:hypothetical protein
MRWRPLLSRLTGVLCALLLLLTGCAPGGDQGHSLAGGDMVHNVQVSLDV